MISEEALTALIQEAFPGAEVAVFDTTGTLDHYRVYIASPAFAGKNLIEQHQLVYSALDEALKDGRVHALEIKTAVPV